jgi:phosphate acetyltransferase
MADCIYVTSTHAGSGKTSVALGLVGLLERSLGRVAYFKPIIQIAEPGVVGDIELVKEALGLPYELGEMGPFTIELVRQAVSEGRYDEMVDAIIEAYQALAARADFVVIEGTDYQGAMASFEFDINADLSKNLGAPVVLVADAANAFETTLTGKVRDPRALETMLENVRLVKENLEERRCEQLGLVLNRTNPEAMADLRLLAAEPLRALGMPILGALPRDDSLDKPSLREIAQSLHARVLSGTPRLDVLARLVHVAAMGLDQVLARLERGVLVLVPGDRSDLLLGLGAAYGSAVSPSPSGIVLTGGIEPAEATLRLFMDLTRGEMPVLAVPWCSYETALKVSKVQARLDPSQRARIELVKELVEQHVDVGPILARAAAGRDDTRVTPKQFMHRIVDLARKQRMHIVLPEGVEERVLRAAEVVRLRGLAKLTLLGDVHEIERRVAAMGLDLEGVQLVEPASSAWRHEFAQEYLRLRAHKNPDPDLAFELMADPAYFGTMMVQLGRADGMVSGAITTTAATLRPALEFVRTAPGFGIASSVFFMLLPDSVLVYGDCAVNPNPSAEQLADIALASAGTARAFGLEPRVAMLSYSTGASGKGSDVEKVRSATAIVRERAPDLLVEGPIQYDAAIDPAVARTKLPDSLVAGKATVFVFPDLNAGNNTYKAVQRAARAIAVGPVMQGLRKPVNDLSRGCSVPDIINTIAITAVQAQRAGGVG